MVLELVVEQALLEYMLVVVELVSVLEQVEQAEQVFMLEALDRMAVAVVAEALLLLVLPLQVTLVAQEAKVVGNDRYAASEWQLASDAYTEAIMWAPPDAEVRPKRIAAWPNR